MTRNTQLFRHWSPYLEYGCRIIASETDEPTIAVDTEADLRAIEAHLARRGARS